VKDLDSNRVNGEAGQKKVNQASKERGRYRSIGSTKQSDFIGADIAGRLAVFRPDFDPFPDGTHHRYLGSLADLRHGARRVGRLFVNGSLA
jgi:hypothetical protein